MKLLIRLYAGLLRLYPRDFREQFASDMLDIYQQTLRDARSNGRGALLWRVLLEVATLPPNILHEHQAARQRALSGGSALRLRASLLPTLFCITLLLGLFAIYSLLTVGPFFAYGVHLEPVNAVRGGMFDPKGYPLFLWSSPIGSAAHIIAVVTMVLVPVYGTLLSAALLVCLGRDWLVLSDRIRRLGLLALAAGVSMTAFFFSPLGRLILTWHMD